MVDYKIESYRNHLDREMGEPCNKFYKYEEVKWGLEILQKGTLKFSNPVSFNDPFDSNPYIPSTMKEKIINKVIEQCAANYPKEGIDLIKKIIKEQKNFDLRALAHKIISEKIAITCFSKSPHIVPMWAHYAKDHTGCVIEMQYSKELENKILKTNPRASIIKPYDVQYTDERPMLCDKDGYITPYRTVFYKSKQWEYEKEVRACASKEDIYKFSRHQITKVYTGLRIGSEDLKLIKEAVSDLNKQLGTKCKIVSLGIAHSSYKLI